ncbi:hypothetical protein F1C16_12340 [Hymenobacter sp. NBH84]|uniref:GAF domain-containing protein n=1 Tax=Hymenobacter sp. NBH84 TaxID=2596915 RepID=UPI0016236501|nr:GAF domain-containing protein [Hymenobacter sp. NBH84]QNE40293.1 hypothetical protein F1C16_12340 [Hymenobacter sp. NBH84]
MVFPDSLIPSNEKARLQALAPFRVLQALPDVVFDALVELVALLFNAPVAMLSFVDADVVWMKALYGLSEPRRVPRDQSLCSVTILQDTTTVVQNLNEVVLPTPIADLLNEMLQLHFYVGHPLQMPGGYNIGVLGIAGRNARLFDEAQQQRLSSLASVAMQLLQLRLALPQCRENPSPVWTFFYDELVQCIAQLEPDSLDTASRLQAIDQIIALLQRDLDRANATLP